MSRVVATGRRIKGLERFISYSALRDPDPCPCPFISTLDPSLSRSAPSTTTRSPSERPDRMEASPPWTSPITTWRTVAVWSGFTA